MGIKQQKIGKYKKETLRWRQIWSYVVGIGKIEEISWESDGRNEKVDLSKNKTYEKKVRWRHRKQVSAYKAIKKNWMYASYVRACVCVLVCMCVAWVSEEEEKEGVMEKMP